MTWHLHIENVAGIREGEATVEPGLNAVRGTNWQGKSSFIRAVETALGVGTPLTEGADRGRVELETDDGEYAVTLHDGEEVTREGTPYLTDEYDVVRADLYACLDERNAVRTAVRRGENLEAVLTRPLDFQNIDERIAERRRERERVDRELADAREAARQLPGIESRIAELETEIEAARERLRELPGEEADGEGEQREELSRARAERDRAASRVERLETSIERTEATLAEKRAALDALDVPEDTTVEPDLAEARQALEAVRDDVDVLQSLYSANRRVLDEDRLDLVTSVDRDLLGDAVTCWVCGSEADRETVSEAVEALGERIADLRAEAEARRDRVERLEARREELDQTRRRRADLEETIADLEATLADRRESLAEARGRHEELTDRVERLSTAVEETVAEATDLESEIKYRETELEEAREERETLESRADRLDALEERREALTAEIEELRTRKEDVKRGARKAFDEAMRELLARFDTGFETARLTPEFDLVVARDGREAGFDALSEGERELLGVVAALAGHESFDVGERVPVLLLDGIGSLADDNLHTLVEYLRDRADYLVFTAYPEHAAFDGTEIDPGDWTVVSDDPATVASE